MCMLGENIPHRGRGEKGHLVMNVLCMEVLLSMDVPAPTPSWI